MSVFDTLKRVAGFRSEEEKFNEKTLALQEKQLEAQSRIPASEAAYAVSLTKTSDSDMKELGAYALDSNPDIEEFKSQLRGYRLVEVFNDKANKSEVIKQSLGKPAMNDDGINYCVGIMHFYSSKGFTLTNYTGIKDGGMLTIKKMAFIESIKIAATLATRRIEWEIDPIKRSTISNHLSDYIFSSMCRSLDMQTASKYWQTQKGITHINQNMPAMQEKQRTGLFG